MPCNTNYIMAPLLLKSAFLQQGGHSNGKGYSAKYFDLSPSIIKSIMRQFEGMSSSYAYIYDNSLFIESSHLLALHSNLRALNFLTTKGSSYGFVNSP